MSSTRFAAPLSTPPLRPLPVAVVTAVMSPVPPPPPASIHSKSCVPPVKESTCPEVGTLLASSLGSLIDSNAILTRSIVGITFAGSVSPGITSTRLPAVSPTEYVAAAPSPKAVRAAAAVVEPEPPLSSGITGKSASVASMSERD